MQSNYTDACLMLFRIGRDGDAVGYDYLSPYKEGLGTARLWSRRNLSMTSTPLFRHPCKRRLGRGSIPSTRSVLSKSCRGPGLPWEISFGR